MPTPGEPTRHPLPPEAWRPAAQLAQLVARPLDRFFRIEAASGIVLIFAAAVALVLANSRSAASYAAFWHAEAGLQIGPWSFHRSLEWVVNDALMAIFFFVVGMEIRREMHDGELSSVRRAALPALAALGGMLAPAGIYLLIASSSQVHSGWGVPMATDIAFAVGVLALLGSRVPPALRALLLALAVIDDLGAIIVIAVFYSGGIQLAGLLVAALGLVGIFVLRSIGTRTYLAYVVPGAVVWAGTYASGVHPTIAGVVVGLITPVRAWMGAESFVSVARDQAQRVADALTFHRPSRSIAKPLHEVDFARREALSPADHLIEALHPWVAYAIMPLFALANAGVELHGLSLRGPAFEAGLGIVVALVVGKPLGVLLVTWVGLRARLVVLPESLTPVHLVLLGIVAGIGFTMSLFIAQLAFSDAALLATAKVGVLLASGLAMALGTLVGLAFLKRGPQRQAGAIDSNAS